MRISLVALLVRLVAISTGTAHIMVPDKTWLLQLVPFHIGRRQAANRHLCLLMASPSSASSSAPWQGIAAHLTVVHSDEQVPALCVFCHGCAYGSATQGGRVLLQEACWCVNDKVYGESGYRLLVCVRLLL